MTFRKHYYDRIKIHFAAQQVKYFLFAERIDEKMLSCIILTSFLLRSGGLKYPRDITFSNYYNFKRAKEIQRENFYPFI